MSKITLITSMNTKLFNEYGRVMLESFSQMALDVELIVAFEGEFPPNLGNQQGPIRIIELKSDELSRFQLFFGGLYEAHGCKIVQLAQPNGQIRLEPIWDYRFNLIRFAFKIFSIDIARKFFSDNKHFAWIDADVICHKPFRAIDLQPFFPDREQIVSYLGRTHFPPNAPYSECGFLGFNAHHPQLNSFLDRMKALYLTGEAFRFQEWHDSWLWDEVRKEFELRGFSFKNISGTASHLEHPFIKCGLGEYFDHLKGPQRKQNGRSFDLDFE